VLAGVILALAFVCIEAGADELPNPFFAMDTGTQDATHKTPAEQVALVKEIGFAGYVTDKRGTPLDTSDDAVAVQALRDIKTHEKRTFRSM
jgi:hypothetical protein